MKKTDKNLLYKGVKYSSFTALLMFTAPLIIWQAFKNQENDYYLLVLSIGLITAISSIMLGFYSLKLILQAIFDKK